MLLVATYIPQSFHITELGLTSQCQHLFAWGASDSRQTMPHTIVCKYPASSLPEWANSENLGEPSMPFP